MRLHCLRHRRFRLLSALAPLMAGWLLVYSEVQAYTVYVSSEKDNTITLVDGETYEVLQTVSVGERPRGIALSKDHKAL